MDRPWKIAIVAGLVLGGCAIILSFLSGSHLNFGQNGGGSHFEVRLGPGGGLPASFLGSVSIILLILGGAFWAMTKETKSLADSTKAEMGRTGTTFVEFLRVLKRSKKDVWLGGVCGGLGTHSPIPSWIWRVVFLILALCLGTGVMAYVILWVCMPQEV